MTAVTSTDKQNSSSIGAEDETEKCKIKGFVLSF